jgi:hypothetical protein
MGRGKETPFLRNLESIIVKEFIAEDGARNHSPRLYNCCKLLFGSMLSNSDLTVTIISYRDFSEGMY